MNPCPFCGEDISLEARICRHCNRPTLYQIHSDALAEREAHELFKVWSAYEKKNFNWTLVPNYSSARDQWTKSRFLLAWNLTKKAAQDIEKKLKPHIVIISQQNMAPHSGAVTAPPHSAVHSSSPSSWIPLLIALGIFSSLWIFKDRWTRQDRSLAPHSDGLKAAGEALEIPEIQWPQHSPTSPHTTESLESKWGPESIENLLAATVFVSEKSSLGSGFLISSDGTILTNHHVTADMERPEIVFRDGRRFIATKVKAEPKLDISVLKIDGGPFAFLEMGDANRLYPGQSIITIGNPGGLSFTVTRGIVSYVGRMINDVPFIQTDAAINRGNSGGPMITEDLKVVGINTLTSLKEQGISFALPINLTCQPGSTLISITSCPAFQTPTTSFQSAAGLRQNDKTQEIIEHYKKLFSELKSDWKQKDDSLKAEILQKTAKTDAMRTENPDATEMISSYQSEVSALTRERYERQIRYLRQAINLYERQRGETVFAPWVATIDQYIETLRAKDKALSEMLTSLN